ncbi:hypothetical protein BCR42DRAFT_397921 [Absidia repens]|uniref:Uncharacterized protein n=1 Tax=Absidia repens TaxID=90262 RepID=A0A1X2HZY7_9FUNG|nr:hypothetical protein BCR42DRAFT_397921 [Absidia repens]
MATSMMTYVEGAEEAECSVSGTPLKLCLCFGISMVGAVLSQSCLSPFGHSLSAPCCLGSLIPEGRWRLFYLWGDASVGPLSSFLFQTSSLPGSFSLLKAISKVYLFGRSMTLGKYMVRKQRWSSNYSLLFPSGDMTSESGEGNPFLVGMSSYYHGNPFLVAMPSYHGLTLKLGASNVASLETLNGMEILVDLVEKKKETSALLVNDFGNG